MASHLENIFDCDLFRLISFSCLYSSQCVHLYKLDANSHPLQTMPTHHSLIDSPSPRLVPMTKKSKKFEKEKKYLYGMLQSYPKHEFFRHWLELTPQLYCKYRKKNLWLLLISLGNWWRVLHCVFAWKCGHDMIKRVMGHGSLCAQVVTMKG